VATQAQADAQRRAINDLVALAMRDLLAFWRALDVAQPKAAAAALSRVMPELTAAYAGAAAGVAADWYDDLREEAGAPGRYRAVPASAPGPERGEVLARWAAGSLFGASPDPDVALSKLAGGLQRTVANGSRDTVTVNVRRDPAGARFARHASANACAFCRLLATRGAVYWSETTATKDYHDHCHCMAVPVWDDAPLEQAPYVQQWSDDYAAARAEAGGGTKAILAEMRAKTGAR